MFFDLHLAYFETSGPTKKRNSAVGLKNGGRLHPVKLENLLQWLHHRS